jgi:hypothetical protein
VEDEEDGGGEAALRMREYSPPPHGPRWGFVAELSGIIAFWRIFIYTNQLKGLSREDEYIKSDGVTEALPSQLNKISKYCQPFFIFNSNNFSRGMFANHWRICTV